MFPPRAEYEYFIYTIVDTYAGVEKSTLHFFTTAATAGSLKGKLWFKNGFELKVVEVIDFAAGEILDYSYLLYNSGEKMRWYDPQPPLKIQLCGDLSTSFARTAGYQGEPQTCA